MMEGPTMQSLPRSDAEGSSHRVDDKELSADTKTASRSSDTIGGQGSPLGIVPKTPPKNGIPPKRMSAMTNRRPAATSAASSRNNASTSSHINPGTGLNKPPTRPLASSSARRPAASVTAATAASSGHKKRSSISSFNSKRKGDESASEENTKSSVGHPENHVPKPDARKPTTNWAPTNNKTPFPQVSNGDKSQQNTASSTKTALSSATNNSRPTVAQSTSHTNRPLTSSARTAAGASGLDTRKKRLSTIPASPVVQRSETTSSNQSSSSKPMVKSRPTLVTRTSTMSVTIEQRLREMELVHQMLQVAMAEDGDESDEVKEEYGKRVDESLASLRTKLEEARRNEGLDVGEQIKIAVVEAPKTATSSAGTDRSTSGLDKPPTAFTDSPLEGSKLNIELAALQSKVLERYVHPDEVLNHITETTQRVRKYHASELANLTVVHAINVYHTHEDFAETNQEEAEKLRAMHTSEIADLITAHQSEIAASYTRLDEMKARLEEHIAQSVKDIEEAKGVATLSSAEEAKATLNSQLEKHAAALEGLERQLADERSGGVDAASRAQNLQLELSSLQGLLSETNQKHTILLRTRDEDHSLEKEKVIATKDDKISELRGEIEILQTVHSSQFEEAKSNAMEQKSALQSELAALREKFDGLEVHRQSDSATHNENLKSKDQEIHALGRVIEDLQNLTQQTHEAKDKAIDEAKLDLIKEHDKIVSDLHRKHREAIDAVALAHERELETHRKDQSISLDNTESTVTELKNSLELSERALEAAMVASRESSETNDALNLKVRTLESERDEAQAGKISMDDALRQSSSEILSLKKTLETFGSESLRKDEQHQLTIKKMKDELDGTVKALEAKSIEGSSYSTTLAEELKVLRQSHAVDKEAIEKRSKAALQDWQNTYDNLLSTSSRAEKEYSVNLEKVRAERKETLDKHAQDLEDINAMHSKEIDELKSQAERHRSQDKLSINSSHAEKTARAEKKNRRDIDELLQQHEKRYISLRNELETEEREKALLARTAHETALSAVQSELQHHKELLAEAEEQSRMLKERQDDGSSAAKLKEFNAQLEKAQAEAAHAKEEVTNLRAAAEEASKAVPDTTESDRLRQEISELTIQHIAEISKIKENIALESERREKERKQGAEVRDRLVAESERLRHELLDTTETAKEHQGAMHVSAGMLQDANQKLSTARHIADRHKNEHRKALEELRAAQGQIEELKSARSQLEAKRSPDVSQEFEALKVDLAAEQKQRNKLEERLHEAQAMHATRIREMESALKVTTAELVELKTERPNGSVVAASPAFKSGLRSSRWAVMDNDQSPDGGAKEGEELGSQIEGNMAGIQEQVRQMEVLNEDMIDESQRFLSRMQGNFWVSSSDLAELNGPRVVEEEVL